MSLNPSRLYALLLKTGLQQKDNRLYQVLHDLIGAITDLSGSSSSSIISGSGSTVLAQIMQGSPGSDGLDGEDALVIPGPQGLRGSPGLIGPPGLDGQDADDISSFASNIAGADGTFTTVDLKTITVSKGIITSIV